MATRTKRNKKQEAEIRNQRICDALVQREVVQCVSTLVHQVARYGQEGFLTDSGYDYEEDVMPLLSADDYVEPACDYIRDWDAEECHEYLESQSHYILEPPTKKIKLEKLVDLCLDAAEEQGWEDFCREHRIEPNTNDVYEHWVVTDWFASRLKEQGEVTGELLGLTIWGRCTTGQSISMDGVIRSIASEMEILVGQPSEWKDS